MIEVEDVLKKPGLVEAILVHREAHPEPLSGGAFRKRMDLSKDSAAQKRRELQERGIITLWEEDEGRGRIPKTLSKLTPAGLRMADFLVQANEEAAKARKHKKNG